MAECTTVTRKWGNSIGVTLPREVIDGEHIKENEAVRILVIKESKTPHKLFGILKGKLKKSAQQMKDELRMELYDG